MENQKPPYRALGNLWSTMQRTADVMLDDSKKKSHDHFNQPQFASSWVKAASKEELKEMHQAIEAEAAIRKATEQGQDKQV